MRLPFNLKTETNTYQYEAFVSGILFAKNRKHWPYFLSNYIRIVHYFNLGTVLNYYADNPLLLNDGLIQDELAALPMVCAERSTGILLFPRPILSSSSTKFLSCFILSDVRLDRTFVKGCPTYCSVLPPSIVNAERFI